jgi:DNA primase
LDDPGRLYAELSPAARPNANGWALVRCVFHEDEHASLGINLEHGGWQCHAGCGSGDLVSFAMKYFNCSFRQALIQLGVRDA